jgi:hypothetical protein
VAVLVSAANDMLGNDGSAKGINRGKKGVSSAATAQVRAASGCCTAVERPAAKQTSTCYKDAKGSPTNAW